jgi:hypothetical protein
MTADNSKILILSAKYGWAALLTQCSLRSLIFLSWGSRVLCKPIFGHNQSSVQKIFTFSLKRGPVYCGSFNFLPCKQAKITSLWLGFLYHINTKPPHSKFSYASFFKYFPAIYVIFVNKIIWACPIPVSSTKSLVYKHLPNMVIFYTPHLTQINAYFMFKTWLKWFDAVLSKN